jgi:hypothetical protein
MIKHKTRWILLSLPLFILLCIGLYNFPPVYERLSWRLAGLQTRIHYYFNPPDQVSLSPNQQIDRIVQATMNAYATQNAQLATQNSLQAAPTNTPEKSAATPAPSPTPTLTPAPIPAQATINGIRHEYQSFNNCGPANLSMMLNYWGWSGDQRNTKDWLRPNEDDSNVMPEEMAAFISQTTNLNVILRTGGSPDLLKRFIASGFPVIIESGHQPPKDWWMGHYVLVSAYNDPQSFFTTQDSLIMPDMPMPYAEIETRWWRDFNRVYLVAYPPERESEIYRILGADSDPQTNLFNTLAQTEAEIPTLTGRDLFFALFNKGVTLYHLGQKDASALTFDQAFTLYDTLTEDERPWRVLWYRVEAYQAYYDTGRYQDVINLANATLSMLSKRGLEETHYWRGMAYETLGDKEKAAFDYDIAVTLRPTYAEAQQALARVK